MNHFAGRSFGIYRIQTKYLSSVTFDEIERETGERKKNREKKRRKLKDILMRHNRPTE